MQQARSEPPIASSGNPRLHHPWAGQLELARRRREEGILAQVISTAYQALILRRLQPSDAMDVAQDVAFEYLMQIRRDVWIPPRVGLERAVRKRAMARAVDLLREDKRRRAREWKHVAEYCTRHPTWAEPDKAFEEQLVMSCFEKAVGRLTPACRRVFFMIRQEGMSYGEVEEKLKITRSAVSALMVRAQRALRRAFREQGIDVPGFQSDHSVRAAAAARVPEQRAEPWVVRTAQGLLVDAARQIRRELERRRDASDRRDASGDTR
jgi:RNA polymerase sigma factor (sigma-70 family)